MIDERELLNNVISRSQEVPVLVDFWAEWCQPCKVLGPLLDKLAQEAGGDWELVKINVDEAPNLSAQFGVQGIPNCKLIHEGRLLGEFTGAQSEAEIKAFFDKHLPEKPVTEIEQARELIAQGRHDLAARALETIAASKPDDEEPRVLLAQCIVFEKPDQAVTLVEKTAEGSSFSMKVQAIRDLAGFLKTDLEALPDSPVKEDYATALGALAKKEFPAALDSFFDVLIRDREYQEEGARRGFVAVFEYLGRSHQISKKYARRFEMAIFS